MSAGLAVAAENKQFLDSTRVPGQEPSIDIQKYRHAVGLRKSWELVTISFNSIQMMKYTSIQLITGPRTAGSQPTRQPAIT